MYGKPIYETFKEKVFIDSLGKNDLEKNSLSIFFTSVDREIYLNEELYKYITELYKYKTWTTEGADLENSVCELRTFCNKTELKLDVFELKVYDLESLSNELESIMSKRWFMSYIKSYIFNLDIGITLEYHYGINKYKDKINNSLDILRNKYNIKIKLKLSYDRKDMNNKNFINMLYKLKNAFNICEIIQNKDEDT